MYIGYDDTMVEIIEMRKHDNTTTATTTFQLNEKDLERARVR